MMAKPKPLSRWEYKATGEDGEEWGETYQRDAAWIYVFCISWLLVFFLAVIVGGTAAIPVAVIAMVPLFFWCWWEASRPLR